MGSRGLGTIQRYNISLILLLMSRESNWYFCDPLL
jgi:hypothetical protein